MGNEELLKRITMLEARLDAYERSDRYEFQKSLRHMGNKLSFFKAAMIAQFSDALGRSDTSSSSGITMTTGHRFNGNTGTKYYSVGDIVYALKQYGLLA